MVTKNVSFADGQSRTGATARVNVRNMNSLVVEIYGTATNALVEFRGYGFSGQARPLAGVRMGDRVTANSGGMGEVWAFDVTGWQEVEMNVVTLEGGNISINGQTSDGGSPITSGEYRRKVRAVTLANGIAVRATARRWVATQVDWSDIGSAVLRVDNTHDQPIVLVFNRQDAGDFNNVDGTPVRVTIPANMNNVLITPADLPILGASIAAKIAIAAEAAVAPTTGAITIISYPKTL